MPRFFLLFLAFFCLLLLVTAQDDSTADTVGYPHDPFLEFRPPFARSLPVQILLTGIVLTLVVVLFIHLIFTAQYHWPLAPVNYVLQISGVTTLLISLIATIHIVLSSSFAESEKWPYMLSYIAVNIPPLGLEGDNSDQWSIAEKATWLVMNASTSGLIQITHIQFLTLLYPSRLEARLIFFLLGPIAVVAAIMQLISINASERVIEITSAVKNVCNATLSLLFTVALFIWGLLVNRQQAWRTDGGTAVFGASALLLALISTALNVLYVDKEQEYVWLPGLLWAVVLWQSFLGWWWWVGAGSGSGLGISDEEEMEEKLRREAKRESRKREAKERRQVKRNKAKKVWRDMAGALSRDGDNEEGHTTSARTTRSREGTGDDPEHSTPHRRHHRRRSSEPRPSSPQRTGAQGSPTPSLARSVASTATSVYSFITLPSVLPAFIHRWYASIRRAHRIAAQQQAAERVERIRELGRERKTRAGNGWGLGSFWGREERRLRERERIEKKKRESEMEEDEERGSDIELDSLGRTGDESREQCTDALGGLPLPHRREHRPHEHEEGDVEDRIRGSIPRGVSSPIPGTAPHIPNDDLDSDPTRLPPAQPIRPRSLWWWGPLFRWRLQDSTVY